MKTPAPTETLAVEKKPASAAKTPEKKPGAKKSPLPSKTAACKANSPPKVEPVQEELLPEVKPEEKEDEVNKEEEKRQDAMESKPEAASDVNEEVNAENKEETAQEEEEPVEEPMEDVAAEEGFVEPGDEEVAAADEIGGEGDAAEGEEVGVEHHDQEEGAVVEVDEQMEISDMAKARKIKKEQEIFVGGLDRDATEEDVKKEFEKVGEVVEVRILKDFTTNKNKGFAFVKFATKEQSAKALSELKNPTVRCLPLFYLLLFLANLSCYTKICDVMSHCC